MRTNYLFMALTAMVAAGAIASCDSTSQKSDSITAGLKNSSTIEFVEYSDTAIMDMPKMAEIAGKPAYGTIITSGVFPVKLGDADIRPLQDAILSAAYGTQCGTIGQAIKYFDKFPALVEEGDSLKPASMPLQRDSAASEQYSIISVQTMTNTVMSFSIYQYVYPFGAAHGMNGTVYVNYYVPTHELVTADNLFESSSRVNIIEAVRQAAKSQYSGTETMVDTEAIETYDNFYITPGGVTFVYSPYEIAPYAAGEISVSVAPYYLYDYLTPLGKSIFGF